MLTSVEAYHYAHSAEEAVSLLQQDGAQILAGGSSIVALGAQGTRILVDVSRAGLGGLWERDGALIIGATVTLQQLIDDVRVSAMLASAARDAAGFLVRNAATVGGAIMAAPPSHDDLLTALLALDASLTLLGSSGARTVTLEEQLNRNVRHPGELLTEVKIPRSVPAARQRVSRGHPDRAIVSVAIGRPVSGPRVVLGGMLPRPYRCTAAEQAVAAGELPTAVEAVVRTTAKADGDYLASAEYRREVAGVLARRVLIELQEDLA